MEFLYIMRNIDGMGRELTFCKEVVGARAFPDGTWKVKCEGLGYESHV